MQETNSYLEDLKKYHDAWEKKLLLRVIYSDFYKLIKSNLYKNNDKKIVEIGSGIGKIKEIIPECICTDIFSNNYIDRQENAYQLSCENESLANLILFDVFHHLQYPGDALDEFHRVLDKSGRLIIFEPCMSVLGTLVYGLFHPEPLGLTKKIEWNRSTKLSVTDNKYYAAQGNASRIFSKHKIADIGDNWKVLTVKKLPAISYVASGGYNGLQLYPYRMLPMMKFLDKLCSCLPVIFATRMLVVLEKHKSRK